MAKAGLGVLLTLVLAALALALVVPTVLGYERYVITGGSMEPNIPRGSILYAEEVATSSLRRGQVITFVPPGDTRPVTHRIKEIRREDGRLVFQTKGDANKHPDVRLFSLQRATQAREAFHVPYAGFLFILLSDALFRALALGVPALIAAMFVVRALWREGGELLAGEQEAALGAEPS